MNVDLNQLNQMIKEQSQASRRVLEQVSQVIVGQTEMLDAMLIGLLTGGHVLLEGVPGLAKTLTISTLAKAVDLQFQRIQFTPDLLPTDLVGTMIFNPKSGDFTIRKGPVFSNIVLADEINRAPAKVQSALLEAMAEKQVTIGEQTYPLPNPFLVLATQNPLEQEGTYSLPEAQMDRFMFKILVTYPTKSQELKILNQMAQDHIPSVQPMMSAQQILDARKMINGIFVDDKIKSYIVEIVMATRSPSEYGLARMKGLIQVGCSPRATINLTRAARAKAYLMGRGFVTVDDVRSIAKEVLRHRLILTFEADAENIKSDQVINEILGAIEVPA